MGDKRPNLVQEHHARRNAQADQERSQRDHAGGGHDDEGDGPKTGDDFLHGPVAGELALGPGPSEQGIDLQAGIAADNRFAQLRNDHRQGRKQAEADQHPDRRKRGRDQEHRKRPRLHECQRKIFRVVRRPVIGLAVMLVVHPFVEKGWHQQWNADDDIPDKPEARNRAGFQVGQLVDETARPIEGEDSDKAGQQRDDGRGRADGQSQRAIAQ